MPTVYRGEPLPRFSLSETKDPVALLHKLNQFVTTLDERLLRIEGPLVSPRNQTGGEEVYTVSNVTEDRTFDADTVTTAQLADVVGTLIEDLINEGKLL